MTKGSPAAHPHTGPGRKARSKGCPRVGWEPSVTADYGPTQSRPNGVPAGERSSEGEAVMGRGGGCP